MTTDKSGESRKRSTKMPLTREEREKRFWERFAWTDWESQMEKLDPDDPRAQPDPEVGETTLQRIERKRKAKESDSHDQGEERE